MTEMKHPLHARFVGSRKVFIGDTVIPQGKTIGPGADIEASAELVAEYLKHEDFEHAEAAAPSTDLVEVNGELIPDRRRGDSK